MQLLGQGIPPGSSDAMDTDGVSMTDCEMKAAEKEHGPPDFYRAHDCIIDSSVHILGCVYIYIYTHKYM